MQVTILLCQVSEGLVDCERFRVGLKHHPSYCTSVGLVKTAKKFWGRTQAHTRGHLEEVNNVSSLHCSTVGNLRCSAFHIHKVVLGDHALFDLEEMNHNRSHSDHEVVFGDQ